MGNIFNIQRFSIFDGPGIRTAVFFSGCNLRCRWCHNPESISAAQQLKFNPDQCISCGKCFAACEYGAHKLENGAHILDRGRCRVCLGCAKECYAEALVPVYTEMTVGELEKALLTDVEYFRQSGGGVTFSGGEPMLQVNFLLDILKACKNHGIHTAVDTAGAVPFADFEKILPYCDLFLYDVKAFDCETHKKLTGAPNTLILENLAKLSKISDVTVRIPVVAGANTGEMAGIAEFLSGLGIQNYEFMPYHKLGAGKYRSLGLDSAGTDIFDVPGDELMDEIKKQFLEYDNRKE